MAEGGETFENPSYDPWEYDYDDDEGDETTPFFPNGASTPAPGGEQYEMNTMQKEKSGLPSWNEESYKTNFRKITTEEIEQRLSALRRNPDTDLIDTTDIPYSENPLSEEDKAKEIQKVKNFIKARYKNADLTKLKIRFSNKKPMDIVVEGPRGGETKVALDDGSGFRSDFLNKTFVKNALGKPSEEILKQISSDIKKGK